MYLFSSLPKIDGLNYDEVKFANAHLNELERKQTEFYKKIIPYILNFDGFGITWISLEEEVGYLENKNPIHNWFVENLNNGMNEPCFTVEITKNNLETLYLESLEERMRRYPEPDPLIPPRPRCFLGYDYTEFYYSQITEANLLVENLLQTFSFETHYLIYHCF
jgi:hypothetical protein